MLLKKQKAAHDARLEISILRLQWGMALTNLVFIVSTIVAYYQLKGVDFAGFLLVQAFFRLVLTVCELPSGYVSDRWQRRHVVTAGVFLGLLGNVVLWLSTGVAGVLAAEALMAIGISFISGTVSAYITDALRALGRAHDYRRVRGRQRQWSYYAESIATLVGGILFMYEPELPIMLEIGCSVLAVCLLLTLVEPTRKRRVQEAHGPLRDIALIARYTLHGHPELKWLILFPALLFGATIVLFWAVQPMLMAQGFNGAWLGVVLGAYFLVKGPTSKYADNLLVWLGVRRVAQLYALAIPLSFVCMAWGGFWGVLVALLVGGVVHAMGAVIFEDVINHSLDTYAVDGDASDIRATALSVFSLVERLIGMLFLGVAGALSGLYSTENALLMVGTCVGTLLAPALFFLLRLPGLARWEAETVRDAKAHVHETC